jgi:hypothetical protein
MVFVRAPESTAESALSAAALAARNAFRAGLPGARVRALIATLRRDPVALRGLVLREGYAMSDDPLDAYAIVSELHIADLFTEPEVWLLRGHEVRRLSRDAHRREVVYRFGDGSSLGHVADMVFGDRLATTREALAAPIHRDVRALADDLGFDRAAIAHTTETAMIADLRFGSLTARALLESDGAALRLVCFAEDRPVREAVAAYRVHSAGYRRALAKTSEAIDAAVDEALRFDRPEGESSPDRDGELRPYWASAYLQGRSIFEVDGDTYAVFDAAGRATPPEVCVDFVLDTFERASGTWFRPRGEPLGRARGGLDFSDVYAAGGRPRGVIALGKFMEAHTELFAIERFETEERIPFAERERFFGFLVEHADRFRPGDILAIQGMKRDHRIHQHAILLERIDPMSGFPYGLADQMKRPRRRTWEGIMAEAPQRSLLYRARPDDAIFAKIDPDATDG